MPRPVPLIAWLAIVGLAAAVVFGQVLSFEFVSWDDPVNVTNNPNFLPLTARSLASLLVKDYAGLYIPVTYGTWGLLVWLGQLTMPPSRPPFDPLLFHGANLLGHIACGSLLFILARRLTGSPSAALLAALLFVLHPLQVESVCWVTELKGVLATGFSLAALCLITQAPPVALPRSRAGDARSHAGEISAQPGEGSRSPADGQATWRRSFIGPYGAAYLCFVLALLSKPSAVTLPLAVVAVDALALRRPWRDTFYATLPWFLLSLAWVMLTRGVQPTGEDYVPDVAVPDRLVVAGDALAFYLRKLAWPLPVAIDYGRTPATVLAQAGVAFVGAGAVALVAAFAVLVRSGVARAGLLIFLGSLLPVLGLVPFQFQRVSTVADRYAYFPLLGLALVVAAFAARFRQAAWMVIAPLVLLSGYASWHAAAHWRNSEALYLHAVAVNPRSAVALTNLGAVYFQAGKMAESERWLRAALRVDPLNPAANADLAEILHGRQEHAEALALFEAALRTNDRLQWAHAGAGLALHYLGRTEEAAAHYRRALDKAADGSTSLWQANRIAVVNRLARILATDEQDELRNGREAVRLARDAANLSRWQVAAILDTLAAAYAEAGQLDKAVAMAQRAVQRAHAAQNAALLERLLAHLQRFEAGQPLRESPQEQLNGPAAQAAGSP
ncbi:MAG: tetratricopeptide repeat protein [Pirellulales bacterium]|nr:tetratricopeptide repeat protein [Pirellulales bacterium]